MMKVLEVADFLLESVVPAFEKHGFTLNKKSRKFKRNISDCIQIFDLFFYKEGGYISVKPEIRIKVIPIEKIYKSISAINSRPYYTLGNHLFEILRYMDKGEETGKGEGSIYNWLIEGDKHIEKLIQIIPKYFEETILPYFNANSSVSRVDKLLNKYPRELSIHNSLYPLRANVAIIAAKLNKNSRYEELLSIYEEELQEAEETYKEEFDKLKEVLKEY